MADMTISQALRRIKALKGQIKEQDERATQSVQWEDKSPPAYSFSSCIEQADILRGELINLETGVAVANATSFLQDSKGKTITLCEAIRILTEIKGQLVFTKSLNVRTHALETEERREVEYDDDKRVVNKVTYTHHCDLPVAKRDAKLAFLQKQFDELNDRLETENHRVLLKRT